MAGIMRVKVSIPHPLDSYPLRSLSGWAPEWEWIAGVVDSAPAMMASTGEVRCSHCGRPSPLMISVSLAPGEAAS